MRAGLLDRPGLEQALAEQRRWGGLLGRYLVELDLVSEENLVRALSTQYKMPAVTLTASKLDVEVARLVPQRICERHRLICFRADTKNRFLDIAMANPANGDAIDDVQVATQYNVRAHIAGPRVIDQAITYIYYGELPQLGGEVDLSPDSVLRNDGPLLDRHRTAPTVEAESLPTTRRRDRATREVTAADFLSGEVSLGEDQAEAPVAVVPLAIAPSPQLPPVPPKGPIQMTHSVELPITVEDELDDPRTRELSLRIAQLEVTLAHQSRALEAVVKLLVRKRLLSPQEANKMAAGK